MTEKFRPRPSGEQRKQKTEKPKSSQRPEAVADLGRRKEAEKRVRELREAGLALTEALGLSAEDFGHVIFWASASAGKFSPEDVEDKERKRPTPDRVKGAYARYRKKLN